MPAMLNKLKEKYFLRSNDIPTGSRIPSDHDGNMVKLLIDGQTYFNELYRTISALTGRAPGKTHQDFIYLADWALRADLPFPDPSSRASLRDLLEEKAKAGVDVRILIWFGIWSIPTAHSRIAHWLTRSSLTIWEASYDIPHQETVAENYKSAIAVRMIPAFRKQILLDYGAHPGAAHHMKVACVYDGSTDELSSFCGGMDLFDNFWGTYGHTSFADAPLHPPNALITLPAPQLADGGPGQLPAGDYEVVYMLVSEVENKPIIAFSTPTNITLTSNRSISLTGLSTSVANTLARGVWARHKSNQDLLRLAHVIKDSTTSIAKITTEPINWRIQFPSIHTQLFRSLNWHRKHYRGIAWHDAAVMVQGPAAARVADFIRLRWNDVLNYPQLHLLRPIVYRKGSGKGIEFIEIEKGSVNPKEPTGILVAPEASDSGPGVLAAGDYECLYTIVIIPPDTDQEIEYTSEPVQITIPSGRKIKVSKIPYMKDITIRREIWIRQQGQQYSYRRAAEIKDSSNSAEINTPSSSWGPEYPLAEPIPPLSQTLRTFPPPATGLQSLQVLFTTAHLSELVKKLFPYTRPYSFAPDGEFTVYYGYKKAIAAASRYIYVESQGLWSRELMELIHSRMNSSPGLKVILVTSGEADPADQEFAEESHIEENDAVWDALISQLPTSQRSDVRYFIARGITVHTKLILIDDEWAAIGSANWTDRSMSTDTELQLSILDEKGNFPRELRKKLWAEHLNLPHGDPVYDPILDDIDQALHFWSSDWGVDPGIPLPSVPRVQEVQLPLPQNYPTNPFKLLQYLVLDWKTKDLL